MTDTPLITVVTPSFNQAEFIGETIDSVVQQDYPRLEHIVMDGGSTDETLQILKKYPHLKVISEPDKGQADAINKGFEIATGDIWCFLNSDDTFLPGALHRVAGEIDPVGSGLPLDLHQTLLEILQLLVDIGFLGKGQVGGEHHQADDGNERSLHRNNPFVPRGINHRSSDAPNQQHPRCRTSGSS